MGSADIPDYLLHRKNVMFNRRVQMGPQKHDYFELVLTRNEGKASPTIYAAKEKQVLALCDLSTTIVKDIECEPSDFVCQESSSRDSKLFDFDVCFSYAGRSKYVFLLLQIRDKLLIMTKRNDQITVHKEYENIRFFKVEEQYSVVHIRIEMADGSATCQDLYRLTTDSPMVDHKRFDGVANTIAGRVSKVKAELSTTKKDMQKYFHELGKELRFGPNSLRDVRFMPISFYIHVMKYRHISD